MRHIVKDVVLSLAGLAGLGAIAWLVISTVFGLAIIIFTTGSMSPTMPTGTAAVAVSIPATAIEIGDVVTVRRDDTSLPVTHRVVSVAPAPCDPDARVITMRGDANAVDDQFPYTVTEVKRIEYPVPFLGTAIALSRTPLFMGMTTIGVAALVVWAFWPAGTERRVRPQSHRANPHSARKPEPASRPVLNNEVFGGISE